jgi:hypothetical protein
MKAVNARRPEEIASSPITLAEWDPAGELQWCARARWLRVEGFYVDYDDGRWLSPADITSDEFALSKHVAGNRLSDIEQQLAALKPVFS